MLPGVRYLRERTWLPTRSEFSLLLFDKCHHGSHVLLRSVVFSSFIASPSFAVFGGLLDVLLLWLSGVLIVLASLHDGNLAVAALLRSRLCFGPGALTVGLPRRAGVAGVSRSAPGSYPVGGVESVRSVPRIASSRKSPATSTRRSRSTIAQRFIAAVEECAYSIPAIRPVGTN